MLNEKSKIYGVKASVNIEYNGNIEELCKVLSKALIGTPYSIENKETPPYDKLACYEIFGFEGWLELSNNKIENIYTFSFESYSFIANELIDNESKHDVSLFYSKLIESLCDLKTYATT